MDIIKVKGNTFCIITSMTYIPFYKLNDKDIIMLDSGWAKGQRKGIDELLYKNNLKVVGIICSHAHVDHIGNNNYLKEKYKCIIAMPALEALICSSLINLKLYYSNQTLSDVALHFGHMICKTDIMIFDNQNTVCVCGTTFKILHTPGHSPAHICITTPDDVAYIGDALISQEVMNGSKMPYAYILTEDLLSKTKLYDLKCNKYIVAHMGTYDDITKLITDNINFYKSRAKVIYTLIDGVMTMDDILKTVIENFNINISNRYRYTLIERMLRSYVEYLNDTGLIVLNMGKGPLKFSRRSSNSF